MAISSASNSTNDYATSANQSTELATLASLDTKTPALGQAAMAASVPVVIANNQSTLPVSAASLPLPTGAATSALQTTGNTSVASIDTKTPSLGQGTMSVSSPVVIASNQSSIPVTGTFWQTTQPVSAASLPLPAGAATSANQTTELVSLASIDTKTLAAGQALMASSSPVVIASNQSAVPVSASSLPLPTGAATSALQSAGNTSVASIDTKTPVLGQTTMSASVPVALASNQSALPVTGTFWQATQPVSAASLPLPTGAATSALQTTGNTSLSNIDGKTPSLGQAVMASSSPVVIASNQSSIPVTGILSVTTPIWEDMDISTGGVARSTSISTTFVNLYSYTGAGFLHSIVCTVNTLTSFNFRLLIDGTDLLFGTTGIDMGDANSNTIYNIAGATSPIGGLETVGANTFVIQFANPIKFTTSVVFKAKSTGKPFTGGYVVRSA